MLNTTLANFYERDLRKLIEEINLFKNEPDLWRTQGTVKNPAGNLVLPSALGTLERDMLKDSLAIVKRFRQHLQQHFKLDSF